SVAPELDRRGPDVLLHGDSHRRAGVDRTPRGRPFERRALGARGSPGRRRVPLEGPARDRPPRRDCLPLVPGATSSTLAPRASPGPRGAGLPRRRRALVPHGPAPQSRVPALLLHPRAPPALRDVRSEPARPDLLLPRRLRPRVPSGAPLLLRRPRADPSRSRRALLRDLVRGGARLLLGLEEQAGPLRLSGVPGGGGAGCPRLRAKRGTARPVARRRGPLDGHARGGGGAPRGSRRAARLWARAPRGGARAGAPRGGG